MRSDKYARSTVFLATSARFVLASAVCGSVAAYATTYTLVPVTSSSPEHAAMCGELALFTADDLPSIDPIRFIIQHQAALPAGFVFETLAAIDNAAAGRNAHLAGFELTPEETLGPAKDALLTRINEKFCYE